MSSRSILTILQYTCLVILPVDPSSHQNKAQMIASAPFLLFLLLLLLSTATSQTSHPLAGTLFFHSDDTTTDPPPSTTHGVAPFFNSTTDHWGLFATRDILPGQPVIEVSNATMLLRHTDCPELKQINHRYNFDCTVPMALCILRKCRIDRSSTTTIWSTWCQMLPRNTIAPVFYLNPTTDPTLSPYTRQTLRHRHSVAPTIEAMAQAALVLWHQENRTNATWGPTMQANFQWAQSMVLSRAWNSPRFGCAAIPVLDLANHRRSGRGISKITVKKGTTERIAWGFVTTSGLQKGEEYFNRYDNGDECEVDLYLDYGFIELTEERRPCIRVELESTQEVVVLKRGVSVMIPETSIAFVLRKVEEMLMKARWSRVELENKANANVVDRVEVVHTTIQRILLESEILLMEEVLGEMRREKIVK